MKTKKMITIIMLTFILTACTLFENNISKITTTFSNFAANTAQYQINVIQNDNIVAMYIKNNTTYKKIVSQTNETSDISQSEFDAQQNILTTFMSSQTLTCEMTNHMDLGIMGKNIQLFAIRQSGETPKDIYSCYEKGASILNPSVQYYTTKDLFIFKIDNIEYEVISRDIMESLIA